MVGRFQRVISRVGQGGVLTDLSGAGMTPEQVKEEVTALFEPYFEHQDMLARFALSHLLTEAPNLVYLLQDPWALEMFRRCLGTHRAAKLIAPEASLEAVCASVADAMQGLSCYWSMFHLEYDQDALGIEEFTYQATQQMGVLLEAVAKPYLKALLHQVRISRREPVTRDELASETLGNVVNALADRSGYSSLFEPPPWHLRLHKWRNIAQHHSAVVDGQNIICHYGTTQRPRSIVLTRGELLAVLMSLMLCVRVLKLANTVYFLDNFSGIQALGILPTNLDIRPEMVLLPLQLQFASLGFELLDFQWDDAQAVVIIQERLDADPGQRRHHMTQFALLLWRYTEAPRVTVEYRERGGTPNFRVSASGTDCKRVLEGGCDREDFVKTLVCMIDLKTGESIPPLIIE